MSARAVLLGACVLLFGACMATRPQRGGASTATLGGAAGPTVVTSAAPENPSTPSTSTVEKTTVRVYQLPPTTPATAGSQGDSAREQPETSPRRASAPMESRVAAAVVSGASPATAASRPAADAAGLFREEVTERVTTTLGSAQKDTSRELGARLANLRGVLWVGVALLIGGPLLGWKLGWFTNGCIAGLVGLLLIILSTVIPGHEAWFGLLGLGAIPVVAFVYYRAHHDAAHPPPSS